MAECVLRLFEDTLAPNAAPIHLPAASRAAYVVEGDLTMEFDDGCQRVSGGGAWLGNGCLTYASGEVGARLWRWELVAAKPSNDGLLKSCPGSGSEAKLSATLDLDEAHQWLMRCDRVSFPPGGVALTHVHQGPGIRCCLFGEITIEAGGHIGTYGPGQPWLELGYEPVLAPTTEREETAFIRCFILPRGSKGKSSIRYVRPEDKTKPKTQSYLVFGERFIDLP